jgi:hypothetical protein
MKSLMDGLPSEVAERIHPDWRKNEVEYWSCRDELLAQYRDQWIGFARGAVIAAGRSPVEVLHAAQASGQHPFFTCVGREHEPTRMRRTAFTYDTTYPGEPLPLVDIEFRKDLLTPGVTLTSVIPDTGADASALPWSDCQQLALDPKNAIPGLMGGVGQTSAPTVVFSTWVGLDGNFFPCRVQADFAGTERILGRDVLNRLDILFRGPAQLVIVNP